MKLLDWVLRRKSSMGEASGERVAESLEQHQRLEMGLAPQKKAWLIDWDGTKNYHDLDIQHNGEPHREVKVRSHTVRMEGTEQVPNPVTEKTYEYAKVEDGYLIYHQVL